MKYYIFFILGVIIGFNSWAQPLSGNYSISNGTGGNFQDISSAVSSLITNGVDGPTVFVIDNGIYNEQINIPVISGANATNTITFKPKTNDSTLVVQDNGRGISQAEFIELSKPYTRKKDQEESGSGLGLNICIAILKEHNFSITAEKTNPGTKLIIKMQFICMISQTEKSLKKKVS